MLVDGEANAGDALVLAQVEGENGVVGRGARGSDGRSLRASKPGRKQEHRMQTQDAVAGRALALGLIALRAQYENGINYSDDEEAKARNSKLGQELLDWVQDQRIDGFLSREERRLHKKKLGKWSYEDIGERFWRIESLKAVLWCIQVFDEMPTYFEVGKVNDTYTKLPEGKDVTPFLTRARLRKEDAIEKERDFAQFLNWRCRTEMFRLQGMKPPRGDSYKKVVARALPSIEENGFPLEHDGIDILINGVRFSDLGEDKGHMMSICYERHLALEWVLSEDDWDEAHADT
jgi:hypothetical protein